ncbi:hypothetical protein L1987_88672 [Smallanthus sonchifolius]|nr:hypothetical protein L1987_88672 [Smallanthus sonchifolius]
MVRPIPRNAPSIEAYGSIFESIGTIAVAYNFGPNGRPSNLSEWGIPVGNNHGSSCGTTGPGEDNLLFLLLFLRFGDGGPTVGNSRYKQLDRRGPALLLFHRGAVRSEKQGMSRLASLSTAHLSNKEDDYRIEFAFHVGVESFLRGNLQVQFGGRRASTQPYEYSDYNSSDEQSLTFDSYTIPEDDLELGQLRLLEVDNRVVVPAKSHLRIIVTSADVLHSWGCTFLRPTAEPTLAQPHHPGCEPPEKQAITASGWSSMEPRSKAVDKIEEGVRLPVEQRIRGPVQDRTVPLQRQQTLSTARRHSLSELFQLLHDFVPR